MRSVRKSVRKKVKEVLMHKSRGYNDIVLMAV